MQSMHEKNLYEYAVIRFVPNVEREEFINVGLVMMCKRRKWLKVRIIEDSARVSAFAPDADIALLQWQLASFVEVACGRCQEVGAFEAHERFRWLTAVRSACISTSRPHPGLTSDLDSTFEHLYEELVRC